MKTETQSTLTIMGVALKRPTFWQFTRAVIIGTVFWVALTVSGFASTDRSAALATLIAMIYGSILPSFGIDYTQGRHYLLLIAGITLISLFHQLLSLSL